MPRRQTSAAIARRKNRPRTPKYDVGTAVVVDLASGPCVARVTHDSGPWVEVSVCGAAPDIFEPSRVRAATGDTTPRCAPKGAE